MKEIVFENRCVERLEREYENYHIQVPKELEYDPRKKEEYFEEMELKKIESRNSIFFAFLTIVSLSIIFS